MGSCFAHDDNGYSIEHRAQEVLYGQQRQLLAQEDYGSTLGRKDKPLGRRANRMEITPPERRRKM